MIDNFICILFKKQESPTPKQQKNTPKRAYLNQLKTQIYSVIHQPTQPPLQQ